MVLSHGFRFLIVHVGQYKLPSGLESSRKLLRTKYRFTRGLELFRRWTGFLETPEKRKRGRAEELEPLCCP